METQTIGYDVCPTKLGGGGNTPYERDSSHMRVPERELRGTTNEKGDKKEDEMER